MVKVSVIMPAYNAEKYIKEAIESILNQTFTDFEFIIINDGSNDETKDIIMSYDDPRIVYLENEKNSGIVITLNKGLDYATGEYIVRMDSDDISEKNRFEKQVNFMDKNKNIGLLGTGISVFGNEINPYERVFTTDSKQLKAELIFNSCIAHPTVMIRRSILEKNHLRYNNEFAGAEDYCLWWEISKISCIATLPDILLNYRIHSSQITKQKDEQYYKMMHKSMKLRFEDVGIILSTDEESSFEIYCNGRFERYTFESLQRFVDCLHHILNYNRISKYFDQAKLNKIFELAIIFSLDNSNLKSEEKKEIYKYAIENGIFTMLTRLKMFYHQKYR